MLRALITTPSMRARSVKSLSALLAVVSAQKKEPNVVVGEAHEGEG